MYKKTAGADLHLVAGIFCVQGNGFFLFIVDNGHGIIPRFWLSWCVSECFQYQIPDPVWGKGFEICKAWAASRYQRQEYKAKDYYTYNQSKRQTNCEYHSSKM